MADINKFVARTKNFNAKQRAIILTACACVVLAISATSIFLIQKSGNQINGIIEDSRSSRGENVLNLPSSMIKSKSETQPTGDWTDSDGFIHSSNGNIYSSDKKWIWKNDQNDWIRNVPATQLTDRALKVAAQVITYSSATDKSNYIQSMLGDSGTEAEAVRVLAYDLDSSPESLALAEAQIERYLNSNKNNVSPRSIFCTTSSIGDFINTYCN